MRAPQLIHRALLAALSPRINVTADPVYEDIAWVGACLGLIARPATRRMAAEALRVLGRTPSRRAIRQLAWKRWYLRTASGVLSYQADRLTPAWIESHVLATRPIPEAGCILVSVHHYNQRLSFARLRSMVPELGAVSMAYGLAADDPQLQHFDRVLSPESRRRALSRFRVRVFGSSTFSPGVHMRQGLDLLHRGGSLVVLADYSETKRATLFGRSFPIGNGAVWFAQRSAKPIVPFMVTWSDRQWRLWCGDQIAPTEPALVGALEDCVRQEPAAWLGWPEWYAGDGSQRD